MHYRGKNGISRIVDTHLGQPQGLKGKNRTKECSYVEPSYSNIAVQRTVNDHTSNMIRVRAKFKMDGEISKHWSASKLERL